MNAKFIGKRREARNVSTYRFRPDNNYAYEAGQFAHLEFDHRETHYKKHFTLSNSPKREGVEISTIVSDSGYKKALDALPTDAPVVLSDAMGAFTLGERKSDFIAFLAGGIGITPVRAILEDLADQANPPNLTMALFYSNRDEGRIAFRDELDALAESLDLSVVHTLTDLDEDQPGGWENETGYIDAAMLDFHLTNPHTYTFYVSGPPAFNDAMQKVLEGDLGITGERIVRENFTGY